MWNLLLRCKARSRYQVFGSCLGVLLSFLPMAAQGSICEADLAAALDRAIAAEPLLNRTRIGFLVETQVAAQTEPEGLQGTVLYARDADKFFVPASNAKLLSTAAALDLLGPDYRISTTVHGTPQPNGLTTLRVVGRGDPAFTGEDMQALAAQLQQQGVTQVSQLVGDDAYFPGSPINPNWEWEDVQAGYGTPVNSLIVNLNALNLTLVPTTVGQPLKVVWDDPTMTDTWAVVNASQTIESGNPEYITVGRDLSRPILYVQGQLIAGSASEPASISVPDPGENFVHQFQQVLISSGIPVARTAVSTVPTADIPPVLARVESPPLAELLQPTNQNSKNLYAEALLKTTGVVAGQGDPDQATVAGVTAVTGILHRLGVPVGSFLLADGSGLSRHNLVTPQALVTTLQAMAVHPDADTYRNSLAVAGVSGTLRNRFRDTVLENHLRGKTGALTGNVALSGYLDPPDYEPLVFSILINNSDQRASVMRGIMDELMLLVAQVTQC